MASVNGVVSCCFGSYLAFFFEFDSVEFFMNRSCRVFFMQRVAARIFYVVFNFVTVLSVAKYNVTFVGRKEPK